MVADKGIWPFVENANENAALRANNFAHFSK